DDDHLALQCRIASLGKGQDVAIAAERLEVTAFGTTAGQSEFFDFLDDISAGGPIAARAGLASLESVVGQRVDKRFECVGGDRARRFGSHRGFGGVDCGSFAEGANEKKECDAVSDGYWHGNG